MKRILFSIIICTVTLINSGCTTISGKYSANYVPPTMHIREFKCHDPITSKAVHNIFLNRFVQYSDVVIVSDENADIIVDGTISVTERMNAFTSGEVVSGISTIAYKYGNVIAGANYSLADKVFATTEKIADMAAERLRRVLIKNAVIKGK